MAKCCSCPTQCSAGVGCWRMRCRCGGSSLQLTVCHPSADLLGMLLEPTCCAAETLTLFRVVCVVWRLSVRTPATQCIDIVCVVKLCVMRQRLLALHGMCEAARGFSNLAMC
jgi:hypothetical protein